MKKKLASREILDRFRLIYFTLFSHSMKKLFLGCIIIACCSVVSFSVANFSVVLSWMHSNGLTKYNTLEAFRGADNITRGESAKFVDQYGQFM